MPTRSAEYGPLPSPHTHPPVNLAPDVSLLPLPSGCTRRRRATIWRTFWRACHRASSPIGATPTTTDGRPSTRLPLPVPPPTLGRPWEEEATDTSFASLKATAWLA
jgi:hypothetical protein